MRTGGLNLDAAPPLDVPLRYLLTGPLFGVAAGLTLAGGGGALLRSPWLPATLALTHLVTLGWVTMVMLGAIQQIVPVLAGGTLPAAGLARAVHAAITAGTLALAAGLLAGSGLLLAAALVLLGAGFAVVLVQLGLALGRTSAGGESVGLLRLAVAALAATVVLGLFFAGSHALGLYSPRRAAFLATHVYLGLAGWIGALLGGVGLAVIPMFYLAPPASERRGRLVAALLAGALLTAPPVLFATEAAGWLLLPWALGTAALAVFAFTVGGLLRARRRRVTDTTLRYWRLGLLAGLGAAVLPPLYVLAPHPRWLLAFGVLYLVGFAGAVEHGMLCKIVPFLVWLHRFSRQAGAANAPLMKDLLSDRQAARQWALYLAALVLLVAATLAPWDALARLAGLALAGANAWLFVLLLRAVRFPGPG